MAARGSRGRRWLAVVALGSLTGIVLGGMLLRADMRPEAPPRLPSWLMLDAESDEAMPDDVVIREDLQRAIELRRRERFDRVLDARDPGELIEHATLTETVFERRTIGIDALFVVGD